MRRLTASLAIAAALVAAPLAAARPAALAGHYYLQGVMETGSELLMTPDGRFQWYLTYGALDLFAEGTWDEVKGEVVLTSKADSKAPPPGFDTLKLTVRDGRLIPPDGKGAYVREK